MISTNYFCCLGYYLSTELLETGTNKQLTSKQISEVIYKQCEFLYTHHLHHYCGSRVTMQLNGATFEHYVACTFQSKPLPSGYTCIKRILQESLLGLAQGYSPFPSYLQRRLSKRGLMHNNRYNKFNLHVNELSLSYQRMDTQTRLKRLQGTRKWPVCKRFSSGYLRSQ